MTYYQSGSIDESSLDYEGWGYRSYYEPIVDENADFLDMCEEWIQLGHWMDAEGESWSMKEISFLEEELVSRRDLEDFEMEQEVEGPTGNAGMSMERWYRQTMFVLWPESLHFRILAKEGKYASVPALAKMVESTENPEKSETLRVFASEILSSWQTPSYFYYSHKQETNRDKITVLMLEALHSMEELPLLSQFLRERLSRDYVGTEGPIIHQICRQFGWKAMQEDLQAFFAALAEKPAGMFIEATKILEDIWGYDQEIEPEQRAVCTQWARTLFQSIQQREAKKINSFSWKKQSREKLVPLLFRVLAELEDHETLNTFVQHALATPKRYPLREVLVPAVHQLPDSLWEQDLELPSYQLLFSHCVEALKQLTAAPVPEPTNWKQKAKVRCSCQDCKALQRFLANPKEQTKRFSLVSQRRSHLEYQIRSDKLDLDHTTETRGRPYTLVCTKNRATYLAQCKQFDEDAQSLKNLQTLQAELKNL